MSAVDDRPRDRTIRSPGTPGHRELFRLETAEWSGHTSVDYPWPLITLTRRPLRLRAREDPARGDRGPAAGGEVRPGGGQRRGQDHPAGGPGRRAGACPGARGRSPVRPRSGCCARRRSLDGDRRAGAASAGDGGRRGLRPRARAGGENWRRWPHQLAPRGRGRATTSWSREQGRLQDEFERLDGYTVQARLETALRGVGLLPETWDRPVDQLSGGERRRAALAAVLLAGADLLLLDEPTNHLDLESCEWLEGFLEQLSRRGGHRLPRPPLPGPRGHDAPCTWTAAGWSATAATTPSSTSRAACATSRTWRPGSASRPRSGRPRSTSGATSRARRPSRPSRAASSWPRRRAGAAHRRAGPVPLRPEAARGPAAARCWRPRGWARATASATLLADLDLHVSRGDRMGIVGPNGCGKSTLLKMLAGRVVPDAGRVVRGPQRGPGLLRPGADQRLGPQHGDRRDGGGGSARPPWANCARSWGPSVSARICSTGRWAACRAANAAGWRCCA